MVFKQFTVGTTRRSTYEARSLDSQLREFLSTNTQLHVIEVVPLGLTHTNIDKYTTVEVLVIFDTNP